MDELLKENAELKQHIIDLEERLKKYTNTDSHKRYYEKNKDKVIEKSNGYLKKLSKENPEKLKEYRHRAYLRQKERREKESENPSE